MATRRLIREIDDIQIDFEIHFVKSNYYHWIVTLPGPQNTPYEQGLFVIDLKIPEVYPMKPPKARFLTKVFHPNIDIEGAFCDCCCEYISHHGWKLISRIPMALFKIQNMLAVFNLDCIKNEKAYSLYLNDIESFRDAAREWTNKYAI